MAERKKKTAKAEEAAAEKIAETASEQTAEAVKEQPTKPTERLYTEAEVHAMIQQLLSKQEKKPEDEMVVMYYAGVCAPGNEAQLGDYGVIRPGQYLEVPKKEFGGKFMGAQARKFIEKRRLIVLSGLNDAERVRWGCDYKPGEVLDVNAFDGLLNMPLSQLAALFNALCVEHKEFLSRYITGLVDGAARAGKPIDNRVSLAMIRALNPLSKCEKYPEGMLAKLDTAIREKM